MTETPGIDPTVAPSGPGCAECVAADGWWLHLRRCAQCGHIGCCDTSPSQHATAHANSTGHPLIRSFEPGEDWYWSYRTRNSSTARRWRRRNITRSSSPFRPPPRRSRRIGGGTCTDPACPFAPFCPDTEFG